MFCYSSLNRLRQWEWNFWLPWWFLLPLVRRPYYCRVSTTSPLILLIFVTVTENPQSDNFKISATHLEPDILECEVKWAWGSIAMNKASGGDGIPVELFQILKDDVVKVLYSICQQIWKTQQWPQDWKRSVFIPIPKKSNAKECSNYHTVVLISHASKVMLKILQAGLQQYVNH